MKGHDWEQIAYKEVLAAFDVDQKNGLSNEEVIRRQKIHGKNILEAVAQVTPWERILQQFKSPLVFILLIAGIITLLLAEYIDSSVPGGAGFSGI